MGDRDQTVYYRLPCSVVRIEGTVTVATNAAGESVATQTSSALGAAGGQIQESLDQAAKIKAAFPAPTDPKLRALQQQVERKELEARLAKAQATIAGGGNASGSEE